MIEKLNNNKIFEELYCLFMMIIAFVGWKFNYIISSSIIVVFTGISIFIFNNFKYAIPGLIFIMFSYGLGFDVANPPTGLIICILFFIICLIAFMIKKRPNVLKVKYALGPALLAISCILPYFWHNDIIPEDKKILNIMYLAWFIYFMLYIIYASNLEKNSFSMTVNTMSYLAVLITVECAFSMWQLHIEQPSDPLLSLWFNLGWGICNEAGIMLCFAMPFVFIKLLEKNKLPYKIINYFKLIMLLVGIVLSNSRGAILFGCIELALSILWFFIISKNKIKLLISVSAIIVIGLVMINCFYGITKLFYDIKDVIFKTGFDDNGRKHLWEMSKNLWSSKPIYVWLGTGIVGEFTDFFLVNPGVFPVYHSTFYETLTCFGIIGLIFLLVHIVEKYSQLFKLDKNTAVILLIGYLCVDAYGMIDNTYHMWYYTVPLMITMASINTHSSKVDELSLT